VSEDAVDVANTEVPEQVFDQVPIQEAPEQVAPEQSLRGHRVKGKSPGPIRVCLSRP
jgi:hypothetical protein